KTVEALPEKVEALSGAVLRKGSSCIEGRNSPAACGSRVVGKLSPGAKSRRSPARSQAASRCFRRVTRHPGPVAGHREDAARLSRRAALLRLSARARKPFGPANLQWHQGRQSRPSSQTDRGLPQGV